MDSPVPLLLPDISSRQQPSIFPVEELIAASLAIQLRYSATEECSFSECHDSQSPQDQAGQGALPLEQGELASLAASFMEVWLPHGARAQTPGAS